MTKIDGVLFSHIQNDYFLKGTCGLQGISIAQVLAYYEQYFADLPPVINPTVAQNIAQKRASLQMVAQQEKLLANLNNQQHSKQDIESLASQIATEILSKLQQNEEAFIDGGWLNDLPGNGHGMLYQFKWVTDKPFAPPRLVFCVYNTGGGISYHEKTSTANLEYYCPIKAYQLEQLPDQKQLSQFIYQLLLPNLPNHPVRQQAKQNWFDATRLYTETLLTISYINGQEISARSLVPEQAWIPGQISGTCGQRIVDEVLALQFPIPLDAQLFQLDFKLYALRDYLAQQASNAQNQNLCLQRLKQRADNSQLLPLFTTIDADVQAQIMLAIEENARALLDLPADKQAIPLEELTQLKQLVLAIPLQPSPLTAPHQPSVLSTFHLQGQTPQPEPAIHTMQDPSRILSAGFDQAIRIAPDGTQLLTQLEELLDHCFHFYENQPALMLDLLEDAIKQLPLPLNQAQSAWDVKSPFYHEINEPAQIAWLERCQNLYLQASKRLGPTNLPNQLAMHLNLFALRDFFENKFKANEAAKHEKKSEYWFGLQPGVQTMLGELLTQYHHNPSLNTKDPIWDQRLRLLQNLYPQSDIPWNGSHWIWQRLIEAHPELKTALQQHYQTVLKTKISDTQLLSILESFSLELAHTLTSVIAINQGTGEITTTLPAIQAFMPLLTRYCQLENFFISGKAAICPETITRIHYSFSYDASAASLQYGSLLNRLSTKENCKLKNDFTRSQYDFQNQELKTIVTSARKSSNDIQLSTLQLPLREYQHLRTSSEHQIQLTLDYFIRELEALSDHDIQLYLDANHFELGLLADALQQNPALLTRIDQLCQNGCRFFTQNGLPDKTALFFIHFNFLIKRYAAQFNPVQFGPALQQFQDYLHTLLQLPNSPAIQASLHQYALLTFSTRHRLGFAADEPVVELFTQALTAHCYLQAHHTAIESNEVERHDQLRATVELQRAMRQILPTMAPAQLQQTWQSVLQAVGITDVDLQITGQYPLFICTDSTTKAILYRINAERGTIFKGQSNRTYRTIPFEIKTHPLIRLLGLDKLDTCFVNPTEDTYWFETPGMNIRFIKVQDHWCLQKEWCINGASEWYELQPLTPEQQREWQMAAHTTLSYVTLPPILMDHDVYAWTAVNNRHTVLLTQQLQPVILTNNAHNLTALSADGNATSYQLRHADDAAFQPFIQFDHQDFVTIHQIPGTPDTQIHLSRYGLTFARSNSHQPFQLVNSLYELSAQPQHIAPEIASLHLIQGEDELLLVPIQRCYVDLTQQKHGAYFRYRHDINNHVQQDCLQQRKKAFNDDPQATLPTAHRHSAHYVTYPLQNGNPKPRNAEDALYLCYLYMASHQLEKAWAVLDDCQQRFGGLQGTAQEIQYLEWIFNAVPYAHTKGEQKATLQTPLANALRLKALSLYTDFMQQNKPIVWPKAPAVIKTTEDYYQAEQLKATQAFVQNIPTILYQTYNFHQRTREHLTHPFTLSDITCDSLLTFYHSQNQALGALGYEWLFLRLKALQQEYQRLKILQTKAPDQFPASHANRLQELELQLTQDYKVLAHHTNIELVDIDLTIPDAFIIPTPYTPYLRLPPNWQDKILGLHIKVTPQLQKLALDALSSNMEEEDFIYYFQCYYALLQQPNDSPQQKQVLRFCRDTLIASRHIPLDKQTSIIPLLANILYRVNCRRAAFNANDSLADLIMHARSVSPTAIAIFQAVDTTISLKSIEATIALQAEKTPLPMPIDSPQKCSGTPHVPLQQIEQLQQQLDTYAIDLCQPLLVQEDKHETFIKTILDDNPETAEVLIGQDKHRMIQWQQQFAEQQLQDKMARSKLSADAQTLSQQLAAQIAALWTGAKQLANSKTTSSEQTLYRSIEKLARRQAEVLDEQALIELYARADYGLYSDKTNLDITGIDRLQGLLQQILQLSIAEQRLQRIQKALTTAANLETDPKRTASAWKNALFEITAQLITQNHVLDSPKPDPLLMYFQYVDNKLLRKRQVEALKSLLSNTELDPLQFAEIVEQITMGGGKSKIILPLLAHKKANGTNLVIIEVPRALLATNHVDLNQTSSKLFGQRAHKFEFTRETGSSAAELEKIYRRLDTIKNNRDYLVTNGETIQSLELKYFELLLKGPENNLAEWQKQIYWAEQILDLIQNHGDAMIDEVHQGLALKKKLNYTLNAPTPVAKELVKHSIDLYRFLPQVTLSGTEYKLIDLLQNTQLLDTNNEQQWRGCMTQLVDALMDNDSSPLHHLVGKWNKQQQQEVRNYLKNVGDNIPPTVLASSPQTKMALAFYKEQLNTVLPFTLKRRINEHYGPSLRTDLPPAQRALAIPYLGNGKPNEVCRFGNSLEAINFTIQATLLQGLTEDFTIELLKAWQVQARQELYKGSYANFAATPTAQGFARLVPDSSLNLETLDLKNSQQVQKIHQHLRRNPTLIFDTLQNKILPQLETYKHILHSDNINHVECYHTVQATSGTLSNHKTYHQRLKLNASSSAGSDAYIQAVLTEKNPPIIGLDYTNLEEYLTAIYITHNPNRDLRAIIDVSATLRGVHELIDNLAVATVLARVINQDQAGKKNAPIQYVLYFNDQDILCALPLDAARSPIVLNTSDADEIDRILKCSPEARVTLYDHVHTLGIDLVQAGDKSATILTDNEVSLQGFLQGYTRFREFDKNQTAKIIVPQKMANQPLATLLQRMKDNQETQLSHDIFIATQLKMTNLVRAEVRRRIRTLGRDQALLKHQWTKAFQAFLVETQYDDFFLQYGGMNRLEDTDKLLYAHRDRLITLWQECLQSVKQPVIKTKLRTLTKNMNTLIQEAIPLCQKKQMTRASSTATEVEFETQRVMLQHTAQQNERERAEEQQRAQLKAATPQKWHLYLRLNELRNQPLSPFFKRMRDFHPSFSKNLFTTQNYAVTYQQQTASIDRYTKPVHAILFYQSADQLWSVLLDNSELDEVTAAIKKLPVGVSVWLTTTQHAPLGGTPPANIQADPNYQTAIEQARFFNGEFNLLAQQSKFYWLNQEPAAKIEYFETHLQKSRGTSNADIAEFKTRFSEKNTGINYLRQHAFDDLRDIDWQEIHPELLATDISALQQVATAFHYVNTHWQVEDLNVENLQNQFGFSIEMIPLMEEHLKQLTDLKKTIELTLKHNAWSVALSTAQQDLNLLTRHEPNFTLPTDFKNEQTPAKEIMLMRILYTFATSPFIQDPQPFLQNLAERAVTQQECPQFLATLNIDLLLQAWLKDHHKTDQAVCFQLLQSFPQTKESLKAQLLHPQLNNINIATILDNPLATDDVIAHLAHNDVLELFQIRDIQQRYSQHRGLQLALRGAEEKQAFLELMTNPAVADEIKIQQLSATPFFNDSMQYLILSRYSEHSPLILEQLLAKGLSTHHYATLIVTQVNLPKSIILRILPETNDVELLCKILTYPAIDDETFLNIKQRFLSLASQNPNAPSIYAAFIKQRGFKQWLDNPNLSDGLLSTQLYGLDEEQLQQVLHHHRQALYIPALQILLPKITKDSEKLALIRPMTAQVEVLIWLLQQPLSNEVLGKIVIFCLQSTASETQKLACLDHAFAISPERRLNVIKTIPLSSDLLLKWLDSKPTGVNGSLELIAILEHQPHLNTPFLHQIFDQIRTPNEMVALLQHLTLIDAALITKIFSNPYSRESNIMKKIAQLPALTEQQALWYIQHNVVSEEGLLALSIRFPTIEIYKAILAALLPLKEPMIAFQCQIFEQMLNLQETEEARLQLITEYMSNDVLMTSILHLPDMQLLKPRIILNYLNHAHVTIQQKIKFMSENEVSVAIKQQYLQQNPQLTDNLLKAMLQNYDQNLLRTLLEAQTGLTSTVLQEILQKIEDPALLPFVVQQPQCNRPILKAATLHPMLDAANFKRILDHPQTDIVESLSNVTIDLLIAVGLQHPRAEKYQKTLSKKALIHATTDAQRIQLLQDFAFEPNTLIQFLQKEQYSADVIQQLLQTKLPLAVLKVLIQAQTGLTATQLMQMAEQTQEETLLLAIAQSSAVTTAVLQILLEHSGLSLALAIHILAHPAFDASLVSKAMPLLAKPGFQTLHFTLMNRLLTLLPNDAERLALLQQLAHEPSLLLAALKHAQVHNIIQPLLTMCLLAPLTVQEKIQILNQHAVALDTRVKLLQSNSALDPLLLAALLTNANEQLITVLLQTQSQLTAAILMQIAKHTTQLSTLQTIFAHPNAQTEQQMLLYACLIRADLTNALKLTLINTYPLSSQTSRQLIESGPLSSLLLTPVLEHHPPSDDWYSTVLSHQPQVNVAQLIQMTQQTTSEAILQQIIDHPQTDATVLQAIMQHSSFNPTLLPTLIAHPAFNDKLAEKLINQTTLSAETIAQLTSQAHAVNLAVMILNRPALQHFHALVLQQQLAVANEEDKFSLIKEVRHAPELLKLALAHTNTQAIQQQLLQQCLCDDLSDTQKMTLLTQYSLLPETQIQILHHTSFSSTVLSSFVNLVIEEQTWQTMLRTQTQLTALQLQHIANQSADAVTLQLILEHPQCDLSVLQAIFHHPQMTLALLTLMQHHPAADEALKLQINFAQTKEPSGVSSFIQQAKTPALLLATLLTTTTTAAERVTALANPTLTDQDLLSQFNNLTPVWLYHLLELPNRQALHAKVVERLFGMTKTAPDILQLLQQPHIASPQIIKLLYENILQTPTLPPVYAKLHGKAAAHPDFTAGLSLLQKQMRSAPFKLKNACQALINEITRLQPILVNTPHETALIELLQYLNTSLKTPSSAQAQIGHQWATTYQPSLLSRLLTDHAALAHFTALLHTIQTTLKKHTLSPGLKWFGQRVANGILTGNSPLPQKIQLLETVHDALQNPTLSAANRCLEIGNKVLAAKKQKNLGRWLIGLGGTVLILASIALGILFGHAVSPLVFSGLSLGQVMIGVAAAGATLTAAGGITLFMGTTAKNQALQTYCKEKNQMQKPK